MTPRRRRRRREKTHREAYLRARVPSRSSCCPHKRRERAAQRNINGNAHTHTHTPAVCSVRTSWTESQRERKNERKRGRERGRARRGRAIKRCTRSHDLCWHAAASVCLTRTECEGRAAAAAAGVWRHRHHTSPVASITHAGTVCFPCVSAYTAAAAVD